MTSSGEGRQQGPSSNSTDSGTVSSTTTGAVMPKTVKSGVITKRSTVPVTQDRYLEVKINVTGQQVWTHFCNKSFKTVSTRKYR